jgi:hypothetical protein
MKELHSLCVPESTQIAVLRCGIQALSKVGQQRKEWQKAAQAPTAGGRHRQADDADAHRDDAGAENAGAESGEASPA